MPILYVSYVSHINHTIFWIYSLDLLLMTSGTVKVPAQPQDRTGLALVPTSNPG